MTAVESTVSSSNYKSTVEYLTFDNQQKLCYGGYCKLRIQCLGKYLTIEPLNEDFKPLTALFQWKFIKQKNILHIISENKIQDLILVFKKEVLCKKVFNGVKKYSVNASIDKDCQVLIPFLEQLQNPDISRIFKNFVFSLNFQEKAKFTKFLKENDYYDTVFPLMFTDVNNTHSLMKNNPRKRKQPEITKNLNPRSFLQKDKNDVPFTKNQKICVSSKKKIIKKPGYELIEGMINGNKKTRLIIFTYDNEKKYCEEFSLQADGRFACCGCQRLNKIIYAIIRNRNKENEFAQILNDEHVCEPREYQNLSIFEKKKIIKKSDFEIQKFIKDGIERTNLIIFAPNSNRKTCYKFAFHAFSKRFVCHHCGHEGHRIYAKLRQNENDEDYIEQSGEENHICTPRPYTTADDNCDIVLKATDFHFFPQKSQSKLKNIQSRLFIFDAEDRNMGYEFSHTRDDIYQCLGCHIIRKKHKIVTVKLYKIDGTDQYSVRMRPKQIHFCKLRKYEPEKWEEKLIQAPMFQFYFKGQKNQKHPQLIIFISEDKKLCYDYKLLNGKSFHCKGCYALNKHVSASVCFESDGTEYIRLGNAKHVCQPVKFADIKKLGIQLLKSSGLTSKKIKIDKSKIIKDTDFELRFNKFGVPNRKLVIIDAKDRTKCYEYFYRKASNRYFCCKCITVSAAVIKEKDGKSWVKLGLKDHSCESVKYEPEKPIIRKPNFKILKEIGAYVPRLIIFTNERQTHCYKYIHDAYNSKYYCSGCYSVESKRVTVKVHKDSEGEEFIQQSKFDHVCEPVIFESNEFDGQ